MSFLSLSKRDTHSHTHTRLFDTGDFMKRYTQLPCALRDRQIVSIERVYTLSTFYIKSAVLEEPWLLICLCKQTNKHARIQIVKYTEHHIYLF